MTKKYKVKINFLCILWSFHQTAKTFQSRAERQPLGINQTCKVNENSLKTLPKFQKTTKHQSKGDNKSTK